MIHQLPPKGRKLTLYPTRCSVCGIEYSLKEKPADGWTCGACCAEHEMPTPCPTCVLARPPRDVLERRYRIGRRIEEHEEANRVALDALARKRLFG